METKLIKSDAEYHRVLQEAEALVARDPSPESADANRLELLTLLLEEFERKQFLFDLPTPIEAISYRMAEQQLRQKDLIPILGSRSRVSEVLNGKRPLTVHMIRTLSDSLGIPVQALIGSKEVNQTRSQQEEVIDLSKFPVKEMQKRGWLDQFVGDSVANTEILVKRFLEEVSTSAKTMALYRRNFKGEELDQKGYYSTLAWTARVLIRAKKQKLEKYDAARITSSKLQDLARLSWFSDGPRLAAEFLGKLGVTVVVEPRLPNMLLDGAALLAEDRSPVIGLTLRYDRIDYFWFTLLHELAHVWRHLDNSGDAYVDRVENVASTLQYEKEANRIARDALIPRGVWKRSEAFLAPSRSAIIALANELHIHPSIVVGRLQFDTGRYELFRDLQGQGSVRQCFQGVVFS